MSALSIKHSVNLASLFYDSIIDAQNAYYTFVGRPYPWPDDNSPPAAVSTVFDTEQSIYTDLAYGRLVDSTMVRFMIPRVDWTTNTVYDAYDQNANNYYSNSNFYVLTSENGVYKCIFNNDDAVSTVMPSLTAVDGTFSTSDGYVWKYMYTIDSTTMDRFCSNDYITVLPNTSVEAAAIPGAIDYISTNPAGQDYTAVVSGYLANFVNSAVVELGSEASTTDNIYTNSSIYFYSGPGANQIRNILYYDGLNRLAYVDELIDSYINAQVANNAGSITTGQTLVQKIDLCSILYKIGYFNVGDTVTQTDSGVTGTVVAANATVLSIQRNDFVTPFTVDLPIYNTIDSGTLKPGNVSIIAGQSNVIGVGTQFTDTANGYVVGDYIRVGVLANTQIRRVYSVTNNTHLASNAVFTSTLSSNVHYKVPHVFRPNSITVTEKEGTITHVNLTGITLQFSNSSILDQDLIPGELITMVDADNIDQGANGTVAYANSSLVILSEVSGSFSNSYFIYGRSSTIKANIDQVVSYPSITIRTSASSLIVGQKAFTFEAGNTTTVGNLNVVASYSIPNQLTLYRIAPQVLIEGDGQGAKAYAVVNTAAHSSYGIDSIQMIDGGNGYSYANVTIVANSLYGSGATPTAIIAPILGHGANTYLDMGARYVCISTKFDTLENDSYRFPSSGSYRRLGLIKNPLWNDIVIHTLDNDRAQLTISNTSGTFTENEIISQNSTVAGVVVAANSTFMEISSIAGAFTANAVGDDILGLTSGATANVRVANTMAFAILADDETIVQNNTMATGILEQVVSANTLKLTRVRGLLSNNFCVRDTTTNASAKVVSIYSANGLKDDTSTYGKRFNQTARMTLSSNTRAFELYEIVTQETTEASARVYDTSTDLDISFSGANGTFTVGTILTDANTSANAIIIAANSSYLKVTSLSGTINAGDSIINNLSVGATADTVYPVLKLYDVDGIFQIGSYAVNGAESLASGQISFANTVTFPDLVRDTGEVLYTENITPFTKAADKRETVRLVLKF